MPNTWHLKKEERGEVVLAEAEHYFPNTSYATFKTHLMPIIEDERTTDRTTIFDDPKLPTACKEALERFNNWAWSLSTAITVVIPWETSRLIASYRRYRNFSSIGYFHRHSLLITLGLYLPLYPLTGYIGDHLPMFNFSHILAMDLYNEHLGLYRKRLLEARPDLLTNKYMKSKLMVYDDVEFHTTPKDLAPDTMAS